MLGGADKAGAGARHDLCRGDDRLQRRGRPVPAGGRPAPPRAGAFASKVHRRAWRRWWRWPRCRWSCRVHHQFTPATFSPWRNSVRRRVSLVLYAVSCSCRRCAIATTSCRRELTVERSAARRAAEQRARARQLRPAAARAGGGGRAREGAAPSSRPRSRPRRPKAVARHRDRAAGAAARDPGRGARRAPEPAADQLQPRLGSALASIGLTIPVVAVAALVVGHPAGARPRPQVRRSPSLCCSAIRSLRPTTVMHGIVHLVIFAVFLFFALLRLSAVCPRSGISGHGGAPPALLQDLVDIVGAGASDRGRGGESARAHAAVQPPPSSSAAISGACSYARQRVGFAPHVEDIAAPAQQDHDEEQNAREELVSAIAPSSNCSVDIGSSGALAPHVPQPRSGAVGNPAGAWSLPDMRSASVFAASAGGASADRGRAGRRQSVANDWLRGVGRRRPNLVADIARRERGDHWRRRFCGGCKGRDACRRRGRNMSLPAQAVLLQPGARHTRGRSPGVLRLVTPPGAQPGHNSSAEYSAFAHRGPLGAVIPMLSLRRDAARRLQARVGLRRASPARARLPTRSP